MHRSDPNPEAHVRFGLGQVEITPPVGIYHRMFGAASHDRAEGVHRPLLASVMAVGGHDREQPDFVRVDLDHCGFVDSQHREFIRLVSEAANLPAEQVVVAYSHTHAAGWYMPDRFELPGGELIPGYLAAIGRRLQEATQTAIAGLNPAIFTYATARCPLAGHRDAWDETTGSFVCGYNPTGTSDDTVTVARIAEPGGRLRAVLVHYACHPTTLGWDNRLISPDYVGALRELVSDSTGVPCVYWQGACGDLGPRHGFVGDPAIADRNGRMLGHAALSALETLGPPGTEFQYVGPVVSGTTLGVWDHRPLDAAERAGVRQVRGGRHTAPMPLRSFGKPEDLERERSEWERQASAARDLKDEQRARDCSAQAERARRWLGRIANLPPGTHYPLSLSVHVVGESLWITSGGEPYQCLADELRRHFPQLTVLYSPLSDGVQLGYLLPAEMYGRGVYQEEPSLLAAGCLESLREVLIGTAEGLLHGERGSQAA